jgi:hypothetical protein
MQISKIAVSLGTALLVAASTGMANAATIEASLFSPEAGPGPVVIALSGISPTPSQTGFSVADYSISFLPGFSSGQGIVNGPSDSHYAIPVAGVDGALPEYLTGDFGSALTSAAGSSGNYFSTGTGSIVITFTTPQTWLALLWGSVDTGNHLSFNDIAGSVVTGQEVQDATAGFVGNGYQGAGGSAYVIVHTDTPFTTVTAGSSVVSFEFGGVAGSDSGFTTVPEPGSAWLLFGAGIGIVALRRKLSIR